MPKKNSLRTSKRVVKTASEQLRKSKSKTMKMLAAQALVNRKKTSKK